MEARLSGDARLPTRIQKSDGFGVSDLGIGSVRERLGEFGEAGIGKRAGEQVVTGSPRECFDLRYAKLAG